MCPEIGERFHGVDACLAFGDELLGSLVAAELVVELLDLRLLKPLEDFNACGEVDLGELLEGDAADEIGEEGWRGVLGNHGGICTMAAVILYGLCFIFVDILCKLAGEEELGRFRISDFGAKFNAGSSALPGRGILFRRPRTCSQGERRPWQHSCALRARNCGSWVALCELCER